MQSECTKYFFHIFFGYATEKVVVGKKFELECKNSAQHQAGLDFSCLSHFFQHRGKIKVIFKTVAFIFNLMDYSQCGAHISHRLKKCNKSS